MTNPFDQLNLRPQERRILVVVLVVVFVVLNIIFVTPLIGQLAQAENQLEKSRRTLAKSETEIARASSFQRIEESLKKEGGDVLSEELQLQRIVNNQANTSGILVSRYNPVVRTQIGRTNQFFEDQGLTIDFTTGGKELVEFLVGLASGNSMIHVQDMNLRPVAGGTRLGGSILFVASYQKKNAPAPQRVESGSQARPATKTAAPSPATATNPPAAKPKSTLTIPTNTTKTAAPPPDRAATNALKTSSTNSAKPKK
jgi:Tfp pilus assembly protein PilO